LTSIKKVVYTAFMNTLMENRRTAPENREILMIGDHPKTIDSLCTEIDYMMYHLTTEEGRLDTIRTAENISSIDEWNPTIYCCGYILDPKRIPTTIDDTELFINLIYKGDFNSNADTVKNTV